MRRLTVGGCVLILSIGCGNEVRTATDEQTRSTPTTAALTAVPRGDASVTTITLPATAAHLRAYAIAMKDDRVRSLVAANHVERVEWQDWRFGPPPPGEEPVAGAGFELYFDPPASVDAVWTEGDCRGNRVHGSQYHLVARNVIRVLIAVDITSQRVIHISPGREAEATYEHVAGELPYPPEVCNEDEWRD